MPDAEDENFGHRQPAAPKSEAALLGAALVSPTVMAEVGTLDPEDFYITKHGDIWAAMLDLSAHREPIDIVTVREKLGEHPSVDSAMLADLMNSSPTAAHAKTYADHIRNASTRRKIIKAATEISIAGYQEKDANKAQEDAKQILLHSLDSPDNGQKILSPLQQSQLLVEMLEERANGISQAIPTGFKALDSATNGGLRGGDLVVIAARTSVGKSSYAENIAENVAETGKQVLYINLEMSPKKMLERFAKRSDALSQAVFMHGPQGDEDYKAMYELAERRSKMNLTLVNDGMASSASIWAVSNQHKIRYGALDLIVVDYLQLLKDKMGRSGSEVLRISQITASMKALAREHDCPLILISQLNRNVEHRGGEPELHDLRDSGAIEQDSDIVVLMWRGDEDEAKIKIAKQRDGPRNVYLPIIFNGPSFSFFEPHIGDSQNGH